MAFKRWSVLVCTVRSKGVGEYVQGCHENDEGAKVRRQDGRMGALTDGDQGPMRRYNARPMIRGVSRVRVFTLRRGSTRILELFEPKEYKIPR